MSAEIPQNILLIAEGQVGDLLLLTPSIRGLHKRFPASAISVLIVDRRDYGNGEEGFVTHTSNRVLSRNPAITELFSVRRDRISGEHGLRRLKAELSVISFLRKRKFDVVISTFPQDRFALWALFSGARRRIGEGKGVFSWMFTDAPAVRKGSGSVALYYAEVAGLLGGPIDPLPTKFYPSREGEEWADRFLADRQIKSKWFVLLHPGATGSYKIWPPDRFADLADQLYRRTKLAVVVCGGPADRSLVESIHGRIKAEGASLVVEPAIDRFVSLVSRSALLISNDSGPRHAGIAAGTSSLSLFRLHHDHEWGIYPESETVRIIQGTERCSLCPAGVCLDRMPEGEAYGSACLRSIPVEQVLEEAIRMLAVSAVSS